MSLTPSQEERIKTNLKLAGKSIDLSLDIVRKLVVAMDDELAKQNVVLTPQLLTVFATLGETMGGLKLIETGLMALSVDLKAIDNDKHFAPANFDFGDEPVEDNYIPPGKDVIN